MVSLNIAIKREAYDFLRSIKRNNKSFSDVILSFKKGKQDIMQFAGIHKNSTVEIEEKEKRMKELREAFDGERNDRS